MESHIKVNLSANNINKLKDIVQPGWVLSSNPNATIGDRIDQFINIRFYDNHTLEDINKKVDLMKHRILDSLDIKLVEVKIESAIYDNNCADKWWA